jgi:hypothetical protein
MKERQLSRHTKLNVAKEQLQLYQVEIVETRVFMEYLERFPSKNQTSIHASLQLWWTLSCQNDNDGKQMNEIEEELVGVFFCFPTVEHCRYFEP